jgi:hypothetical protein
MTFGSANTALEHDAINRRRHCEKRSDEAIQRTQGALSPGLLSPWLLTRGARNGGSGKKYSRHNYQIHSSD